MSRFVRTCGVGQPGHVCGLRAIGMVAVQSFRDVFTEVPLTPGIVYLCKRHYYDPILGPDAKREQAVSETEGEKGTELRPCDFTGHMALTAECARLRREAAAKDGAIDAIG